MEITILMGPICSGKTTYSDKLVKDGYVRISADDIKLMMFRSIPNDDQVESVIDYTIHTILGLIDGMGIDTKVVIDGFRPNIDELKCILDGHKCEIIIFDVDLFKSNIRNRKRKEKTGVYVDPTEIRRYYNEFKKFVTSGAFLSLMEGQNMWHLENYESEKKIYDKSAMT